MAGLLITHYIAICIGFVLGFGLCALCYWKDKAGEPAAVTPRYLAAYMDRHPEVFANPDSWNGQERRLRPREDAEALAKKILAYPTNGIDKVPERV